MVQRILGVFVGGLRIERLAQITCLAAAVFVIAGSLVPGTNAATHFSVNDKLVHFCGYFVLGLFGGFGWPSRRFQILLVMIGLGAVLEVLQGAVIPGRQFDLKDALANSMGVITGVVTSWVLRMRAAEKP